jgi:hypothetical protein
MGASLPATAASARTDAINLCYPVLQTTTIYAQPGVDPVGTAYKGDSFLNQWVAENGYERGLDEHYANGKETNTSGWVAQSALGSLGPCE